MTNNFVNETSYISSTIVQNKVLNGGGLFCDKNIKINKFFD